MNFLKELKEKLDKEYGKNWCIRKVSRLKKTDDSPSLTITSELKEIGVRANDYVVVAVKNGKIIIEKL